MSDSNGSGNYNVIQVFEETKFIANEDGDGFKLLLWADTQWSPTLAGLEEAKSQYPSHEYRIITVWK